MWSDGKNGCVGADSVSVCGCGPVTVPERERLRTEVRERGRSEKAVRDVELW